MWGDPSTAETNIVVYYEGPPINIKTDDYVHVVGTVRGTLTSENAFGAEISAIAVDANSAEVVDALAAAPKPKQVVAVNQSKEQFGVEVAVEKVEFADRETRVFAKVNNKSRSKASFYSFNAKAVQGTRQLEAESFSEYPQVASDLLPGVSSSGVIVFGPMDPGQGARLVLEAGSDNYDLDFEPYEFTVNPQSGGVSVEG